MRSYTPPNAKLVPSHAERVFKGIIYDVYQWQQKMYDGSTETFEMLKRPDTVKVVAIKDGKIIILDQEQPDSQPFYDVPGGRHDKSNETELEAAKREMLEETGMTFKTWKLVEVTQPFSKIESFVYIFMATDFETQIAPQLDAGEKINVLLLDLTEVKGLLSNSRNRYLPKELFEKVTSVETLSKLPEVGP